VRFADPYLLGLLVLVPIVLWLKSRQTREAHGANFPTLGLVAALGPTWRLRFRWLPTAGRGLALALLVIALARPQTGRADSELPGQGIDITLILDTSSSMTAAPLGKDPRSVVAARVLNNFIEGRKEDRIGLVIFRDQSLVLSPLTLDYAALKGLITGAQQVNLPDGTAIGLGLSEGVNLLRESKARSRVAVLLTDGENNNETIQPLAAARIAETLGVKVYAIGVLDPGARGTASNVDDQALRKMAEITGGKYFTATSEVALASIYQSIDVLEKSRVGRTQFSAYHDLAVYLLAAGLVVLLLEQASSARFWRRAI
jgi:Ca-activated chloride channel family protein